MSSQLNRSVYYSKVSMEKSHSSEPISSTNTKNILRDFCVHAGSNSDLGPFVSIDREGVKKDVKIH